MRIIINIPGAFGDALQTTPVAARLRKEHPDATIDVFTCHPYAYYKNPHVNNIYVPSAPMLPGDIKHDLLLAYAERPELNQVEALFTQVFGDTEGDKRIIFTRSNLLNYQGLPYIVIHPNTSWACRTLPREWWGELSQILIQKGYPVYALGTIIDHDLAEFGVQDTRNTLSPDRQAAVINRASAFICTMSGLLIMAGSTDVPIVLMSTINRWTACAPWRYDRQDWNLVPIETPLDCRGCHDRRTGPVTFWSCPLVHNNCVRSFSAQEVATATLHAIKQDQRKCMTQHY